MSAPSFEYKGVTYLHTERQWCCKTNRHTTTAGNSWGWIEGPAGNVCWSNDPGARLKGADAQQICNIHNQWLVDQEPVSIKLVKASQNLERAEEAFDAAETRLREAETTLNAARAVVAELEEQMAGVK